MIDEDQSRPVLCEQQAQEVVGAVRAHELGLTLEHAPWKQGVYDATAIHRLLGAGTLLYHEGAQGRYRFWNWDRKPEHDEIALLVGIRPIVQESDAHKLLREAASYLERSYPLMSHPEDEKYRADIAYRAKKLLGDKP